MITGTRRSSTWFTTAALAVLLPMSVMAWEPNAKDLDKAIDDADFSGYMANLTTWLNEQTPSDPAKLSRSDLEALLDKPDFAKALAQRQFIGKLGADNLASAAKDPANRAFLTWLLGSTEAMSYCIEGATPVRLNERRDNSWGIPASAMTTWKQIYDLDPESKEGVLLKLAIAVSMSPPGTGPRGAGQAAVNATPLARYNHFKAAYKNGELAKGFADHGVWEYRLVTCSNATDEDLGWGREMVNAWRPDLRVSENVVDTTSEVWRRNSPIPHDGSYKNVLSGGGKCGPRSSWSVFICQAFGIPVVGVGQPAHACAAYKAFDPDIHPQEGNIWKVVYGRGWGASNPGYDFYVSASMRANLADFMLVERMRWLASALTTDAASASVKQVAQAMTDAQEKALTAPPTLGSNVCTEPPQDTGKLKEFAATAEDGDDYIARVRGFLTPPESGDYILSVSCDDDADLFLSTNESPDNKQHIVVARGWSDPTEFKYKSQPISLVAGKRYYIEAVHRESSGGDHLVVVWSGPGVTEGVIPGTALASYPDGKKGELVRDVWRNVAAKATAAREAKRAALNPAKPEAPIAVAPGVLHIEAEAFTNQSQTGIMECYTGGKQLYIGKSINGAFVDYVVDAPKAGTYELTMRTAAANVDQTLNAGIGEDTPVTVAVPYSAGLWATTEPVEIELAKGPQTLKVTAPNQRAVAIRWLELKAK